MKRIYVVYGIITVIVILVLISLDYIERLSFPKDDLHIDDIDLSIEEYGNTISNINNRGHVVEFGENIILTTSKGLIEVNVDKKKENILTNHFGEFLNVSDSKIYFMSGNNRIFYYDTTVNSVEQIKKIARYKRMSLYGDILFGFSGANYTKCDAFSIEEGKAYSICDMYSGNYANYYDGGVYYNKYLGDGEYSFIKYDLTKTTEENLFDTGSFDFTWTIYDNNIIYSYNDYDDELITHGVWEYDIEKATNKQLTSSEQSYRVLNVIGNKLIYSDGVETESRNWYLLDLETFNEEKFVCDGRCESVFVANNIIIVKSTKDGVRKYRFYDENGKYLDFEVLY